MVKVTFIMKINRISFGSNFSLKKILIAGNIKIFVNYSQSMAIINTLNLNWKDLASNMFQFHQASSGAVQNLISLECLFNGLKLFCFYELTVFFN